MKRRFWVMGLVVGLCAVVVWGLVGFCGEPELKIHPGEPVPSGEVLSRAQILDAIYKVESIAPKVRMQTDPNYVRVMNSSSQTDEVLLELVGDQTVLPLLSNETNYRYLGVIAECLIDDRHYEAFETQGLSEWFAEHLEAIRDWDPVVMRELKERYRKGIAASGAKFAVNRG